MSEPEWLRRAMAEGRVTIQGVNASALGGPSENPTPNPTFAGLEPAAPEKRRKYGNKVVQHEGLTFHSKKELRRWLVLQNLAKLGAIKDLRRQVPFDLIVNDVRVSRYTADFVYVAQEGQTVVEDTKSEATAQDRSYRIRKRLMQALFGIIIQEV